MLHTPGPCRKLAANRFLKSLMPSLVLAFYDTMESGQQNRRFKDRSINRVAADVPAGKILATEKMKFSLSPAGLKYRLYVNVSDSCRRERWLLIELENDL